MVEQKRELGRKDAEVVCPYSEHGKSSIDREYGILWCNLSDNPCFKDTGDCDEYNELLKEEANES